MRMITKLTATTVAAAALLGTIGVSSAAAATPSAATAGISLTTAAVDGDASASQAVYHRTFVVANHSSYTLALVGYENGVHADDELPFPDAVVQPGREISFNVTYRFLEQRELGVVFTVWNPQGDQLADYRPVLTMDGGLGLTGIEVREIPDQLGWLPPPVTHLGGTRTTELFDKVTPPPVVDAQHL